jgi:hypothetical protein
MDGGGASGDEIDGRCMQLRDWRSINQPINRHIIIQIKWSAPGSVD